MEQHFILTIIGSDFKDRDGPTTYAQDNRYNYKYIDYTKHAKMCLLYYSVPSQLCIIRDIYIFLKKISIQPHNNGVLPVTEWFRNW